MTTLKQLGFLVLTHIFNSAQSGWAGVYSDTGWSHFGGFKGRQSEHIPEDGQSGQVFYVWGPELGLRKLDMKEFRAYEEAISQIIGEYAQVPTHFVTHTWSSRPDVIKYNQCFVYRFSDEEDRHLKAMLDTALKF